MENNKYVLACDIGGSKMLCGIVDSKGKILDSEKCGITKDITISQLENTLVSMCDNLINRNSSIKPISCGINIPGLANSESGVWVYSCFSGIQNYPIAQSVSKCLNMPVKIENDVNSCARAEKIFGCCKDCGDYLWVTVSNGVGGGLVLGDKLYNGAFGGGGEIGHMIVNENGLPCPCGHLGCLEAMAAGPAISKRYSLLTGKTLSAYDIALNARSGEEAALEIYRETGRYIGSALGKAASLLNLKKFVLGGGVMQSFDLMEKDIKEQFYKEAFLPVNENAEIVQSTLKYEAGLLGAAATALYPENGGTL